jgi:phosphoglycerate dehydrogenase-like enzyme
VSWLCAKVANEEAKMRIAVLDDYQNVALKLADWRALQESHELDVFNDHVADFESLVRRLYPYDILCVMRERTPLSSQLIGRLPNLKLIVSTGPGNASINKEAVAARGIEVMNTRYESTPTIELALALIFAVSRGIPQENASVRAGGWQIGVGADLNGNVLGILGLGRVGSGVAKIGHALGMKVIAWSPNLTAERAAEAGVEYVLRADLFRRADFLSVHLVLSEKTRGLVGASDLELMKPSAYIINTARGAIFDEGALIRALEGRRIAGAALDTFETEPLPADHAFRRLQNVIATPHLGFVSERLYRMFYEDTVSNIKTWLVRNAQGRAR